MPYIQSHSYALYSISTLCLIFNLTRMPSCCVSRNKTPRQMSAIETGPESEWHAHHACKNMHTTRAKVVLHLPPREQKVNCTDIHTEEPQIKTSSLVQERDQERDGSFVSQKRDGSAVAPPSAEQRQLQQPQPQVCDGTPKRGRACCCSTRAHERTHARTQAGTHTRTHTHTHTHTHTQAKGVEQLRTSRESAERSEDLYQDEVRPTSCKCFMHCRHACLLF